MTNNLFGCQAVYLSYPRPQSSNADHWMLMAGLESIAILVILLYAVADRTIPSRTIPREDDREN